MALQSHLSERMHGDNTSRDSCAQLRLRPMFTCQYALKSGSCNSSTLTVGIRSESDAPVALGMKGKSLKKKAAEVAQRVGMGGSCFFSGLNSSRSLCAWFQGKGRRFWKTSDGLGPQSSRLGIVHWVPCTSVLELRAL